MCTMGPLSRVDALILYGFAVCTLSLAQCYDHDRSACNALIKNLLAGNEEAMLRLPQNDSGRLIALVFCFHHNKRARYTKRNIPTPK
ncbi:uncharacterized protein EDB91DRAFT_1169324 [Suillus paluster]|uniref:uncharacterized protein n=1 Tax=Suillus paluster TaxID=48578 RepID=UPI001B86AB8E|nr:uncharacterized protein EDB91DRAFT_1169324 [Suillus paluster]KAG1725176.1 hypothetical protein EDB91DRAFT_1169324 [Suillus paluster]